MVDNMEEMHFLLNPKSIAVVGASKDQSKPGGKILKYLKEKKFKGRIYPVNPNEESILGFKCYKSIDKIPDRVDLACLIIPAKLLMNVMKGCADKGVKAIIINSSGFAELGEKGEENQKELTKYARDNGMRICGPNTNGVINTNNSLFASFSMALDITNIPTNGKISFVTQSGAIGGGVISKAWENDIGLNYIVSSGNEADLCTSDYINFFVEDINTEVICVFLEGINNGEKFKDSLYAALTAKKPVIIYKNGKTKIGQESVKSHTGSLAGDSEVYQTVFKQYGIIEAEELDDILDKAIAFTGTTKTSGNKIGIVSTSGGACTIVADNCIDMGLDVPDLMPETNRKLKKILPNFGIPQNPFDTTAMIASNSSLFKESLKLFIEDKNIDAMILTLTTLSGSLASNIADDIIELQQKTDKPIIVAWTIAETLAKEGMDKLRKSGIPLYPNGEKAVRSLKSVIDYNDYQAKTHCTKVSM